MAPPSVGNSIASGTLSAPSGTLTEGGGLTGSASPVARSSRTILGERVAEPALNTADPPPTRTQEKSE